MYFLSKSLFVNSLFIFSTFAAMTFSQGCEHTKYKTFVRTEGYKNGRLHKAIAVDVFGNSGWSSNCSTVYEAMRIAIKSCEKKWEHPCKVMEIDDIPYEKFNFEAIPPSKVPKPVIANFKNRPSKMVSMWPGGSKLPPPCVRRVATSYRFGRRW